MNALTTGHSGRTAMEAVGLGKRYRRGWAFRDCAFRLPAGRVCGLVGPNGAGKSTLLALASGLLRPTEGSVRVLGAAPTDPSSRLRVAFLAQEKPLYARFTVADTLRMGRELNRERWCRASAERIVREGNVPLTARVGTLSGGQRTRVALAMVFAKRPELLLLDEPMSDLGPLVRHEMMGTLMGEAAEHGTTIVMSTHVLAELEGVCDYLLLIADGRVRVAGEVEDVLGAHRLLIGPAPRGESALPPQIAAHTVVEARVTGRQLTALVRPEGPLAGPWESVEPSLEELLLAYLRSPEAPGLLAPSAEPRGGGAKAVVA